MADLAESYDRNYTPLPTLYKFHRDGAQIRAIVGSVGSGKTTAATWELCYYLPLYLFEEYKIRKTRWCVIRNTYCELTDTTQRTVFDWFQGSYQKQEKIFHVANTLGLDIEVLFRSCDRPEDVKKFKSLELTGYWIDESIEVADEIKQMLKNRIGRYPKKCPVRFGIETTNPPDTEHSTFHQFKWIVPPEAPVSEKVPLASHHGFWQPQRENEANLRQGYYDDLINDYRDNPDWIATYVRGLPGIVVQGKSVYKHFQRDVHVATDALIWARGTLYRGWDNSGNVPACIVGQVAPNGQVQILREFCPEIENIVDFTRRVIFYCNQQYPGAVWIDYGDPAGANKFSKRDGGFTSNAQLMLEACGVNVMSSDQNPSARVGSVETLLLRRDGILIDPSCVRLINGFMGGYRYLMEGTTGRYQDKPEKNKYAHCHDSLQYLICKLIRSVTPGEGTIFVPQRRSSKAFRK